MKRKSWSALLGVLLSYSALANAECVVSGFESVDQASKVPRVIKQGENERGHVVSRRKPPLRCALVTFHTDTTQPRVANDMNHAFSADYVNGREVDSRHVNFPGDQVHTGYITIGPRDSAKAYVCFTHSEVPIASVQCHLR